MKHISSIIYTTLLTALLLGSCASEDMPSGLGDTPDYSRLVLSVTLPGSQDATPATRAGDDPFDIFDNEDDKWGKPGENIERLRVMILDGEGSVECNTLYTDLTDATHAGEYEYLVRNNDTKTVILIANEDGYVLDNGGDAVTATDYLDGFGVNSHVDTGELRGLVVTVDGNTDSDDSRGKTMRKPLPITAIHTEHIATTTVNEVVAREYDMHRASVKYSFRIVNKSGWNHKLEGIRISRVADREYLFPDATYETNSLGHQVIKEYRTPAETVEGECSYTGFSLSLPKNMEKAVQAMDPVYVPEGLSGTVPHKVSVTLDGAPLAIWGELKWRMPGQTEAVSTPMTDLPRNTHVVVNITINDDNTMDFVADVQPYSSVKLDPLYGLERDPNGNIIVERYPDGTYDVVDNGEIVKKDADGDEVIKTFTDGSLYCKEEVLKDYLHGGNEIDYVYYFEKDYSGGNMIIMRRLSSGGTYHGDDLPDHDHDFDDRAMFVLTKEGEFRYVTYDDDGIAHYSDRDMHGDLIIQANGYQFRKENEMAKYIGSYVVLLSDGKTEELRYYKDGSTLDWETGVPSDISVRAAGAPVSTARRKAILARMRRTSDSFLNIRTAKH